MSSNHIAEMAKKQLEMSKAILNAEESDDDDDDLLLLSEPIFSQDSSSAMAADPSEVPAVVSPPTPPQIMSPTTKTFTKQDDEKINAQALRKSKNGLIPSNVTSPSQLKWYRETSKGKIRYHPCRVCPKDEGLGLDLPEEWDVTKKVLIQDIRYPCLHDYQLVSLSSILPYGGEEEKKKATGVKPKEKEETEELHWCSKIMELYLKQLKLKYKQSELDRRTEVFYLNEVLKQAHDFELESKKFAPLIREQEDALMSIKSIHSMDDDLNDSRSIQSVGSNDSEEDNPGRRLLIKDDIRKKEVIRPGDVIAYHLHIYVAGSEEGYRTGTVLSVDPKRSVILVLDSGDCLPPDTQVKRIKRIFRGKLQTYEKGSFKPLTWYKLNKDDGNGESTGAAAGLMEETKRIGAILDKQSNELREKMTGDGFAPVDILRNFKRKEKRATSEGDDGESPSSEGNRMGRKKKLRSKLSSDEPKSATHNASPEVVPSSPESSKSTSSIISNDSKKSEKSTPSYPIESDKIESKETTRPKRKVLTTSKVTNAIDSNNGEAEIAQKGGTKRARNSSEDGRKRTRKSLTNNGEKRKASKISATPDMNSDSKKPKRQRRKAQKLDL